MGLSNYLEVGGVMVIEGNWDMVCGALTTSWRTLHVQKCETFEVLGKERTSQKTCTLPRRRGNERGLWPPMA